MTIAIRVPPTMRDKLQALADKEERTLSWFCMKILREYLNEQERKAAKAEGKGKAGK